MAFVMELATVPVKPGWLNQLALEGKGGLRDEGSCKYWQVSYTAVSYTAVFCTALCYCCLLHCCLLHCTLLLLSPTLLSSALHCTLLLLLSRTLHAMFVLDDSGGAEGSSIPLQTGCQ